MTVPSTTRRAGPYYGNGVATSFPFGFKVFSKSDIELTKTDSTGISTVLVLDSDYSVTVNPDQDTSPGGTITYPISGSPLATGESLVGVGAIPYDQTTSFPEGGAYRAGTHEDTFDRTEFQIQQLAEELERSLTLPATAASASSELPYPEALKLTGWNDFTNLADAKLVNYSPSELATVVVAGTSYTDIFTPTALQTQFVLTANPGSVNALDVALYGVPQINGVDFTVSGTTLTMTTAPGLPPDASKKLVVRYVAAVPVGSANAQDVTFLQAGTGAVISDVQSKLRNLVSVTDFGANPLGTTDSSVAFQSAANYLLSIGGGRLCIPSGTYRLDSVVTFGNCNVSVVGEGIGVSNVIVNNAVGGLLFNITALAVPSPNDTEYRVEVSDLSFAPGVPRVSGFGGSGYAIRVNRPTRALAHTIEVQAFRNIDIRNALTIPWTDPTSPQFDYGLYLKNASQTKIYGLHVDCPGAHGTTGLRIDNAAAVGGSVGPFFLVEITASDIAGCKYGIHQSGWLESVRITQCGITSSTDGGILLDGSGTTLNGSPYCFNADVLISGCHINGQTRCVDIRNWKHVIISDNNMYTAYAAAVGGASHRIAHVLIDPGADGGGESYIIHGNYFNNAVSVDQSGISQQNAIGITGNRTANYVSITANQFKIYSAGTGVACPSNNVISIAGAIDFITLADNQLDALDAPTGVAAVFVQETAGFTQNLEANGNTFRNFTYAYLLVDVAFAQINGGRVFSKAAGGVAILWQGTNRGTVVARGFTSLDSRTDITGSTTPRVTDNAWGRYTVANGAATTITNFTNGYDGQEIDIDFSTGNTTVAHNANIFLQGSVNATFAAGTNLRLKKSGPVWLEQGRRT